MQADPKWVAAARFRRHGVKRVAPGPRRARRREGGSSARRFGPRQRSRRGASGQVRRRARPRVLQPLAAELNFPALSGTAFGTSAWTNTDAEAFVHPERQPPRLLPGPRPWEVAQFVQAWAFLWPRISCS